MDQPVRKLDFTQDMERKAIKLIAQDPGFVVYWIDRLQEVHFNYAWNVILFKAIRGYYLKKKLLPTLEIIDQEVQQYLSPDDNIVGFQQYFNGVFGKEANEESEYVKDILIQHMKKADYDRFTLTYVEMCRDGKHDSIEAAFNQMRRRHVLTTNSAGYLEPGETVAERVAREIQESPAVPSPWPTYNANSGGGFHHGTVTAFMGPTGSGKSLLLVNVGAHLLRNKKTVYYFTFELSREKIMARFDVCLSGVGFKERLAKPALLDARIKAMNLGDLYIIEYPTDTCSTNKLRATIDDYVSRGCKKPDVVIIDYLTIMLPNNKEDVDMKNEYSMLKQVAEDVRGFAMDPAYGKPPIVTAFQSNRGSEIKTAIGNEVKKGDISDSYAVMGVIDGALSINQSASEKGAGKLRLYVAKARDSIDAYTVTCDVKYECLQIAEDTATTIKYQNCTLSAQDQARAKGQIPTTMDPSSAGSAIDQMLHTNLTRRGPVPVFAFQDTSWGVEQLRKAAEMPTPIAGSMPMEPPPSIAPNPPSAPPVPLSGEAPASD
jgi:KaiC/GvpD/RAD55 family RecA-like ATPase